MTAKYPGICRSCGEAIVKGAEIDWQRGLGAAHPACGDAEAESRGFRPGYSTAAMRWDEEQFELNAGESFMAGLR